MCIRTWTGYPEGVAFAIVLMNACTPLIDHYVRPRVYGRDRKGAPIEYPDDAERDPMTTAAQPAAPTPRGIHYQAILLGGVALLAATLLAVADRVTREPIALRQAEDSSASLSQVIPDRIHDNALAKDPLVADRIHRVNR